MNRIRLALFSALMLPLVFAGTTQSAERPNVVVLLADDLGFGDLRCHGGPIPTPNIDRLFREGCELQTLLVMPVCSPTRAALLTGRHPARVGVNPMVLNPRVGERINPRETILAEVFKAAGYRTGIVGKWHLGFSPVAPNDKGFDYFYGFITAATTYIKRPADDDRRLMLNDKPSPDPGYTTDLFRDRAVQFIEDHNAEPFFLYVPFNAVHAPLEATKEYVDRVPESVKEATARTRAGMLIALDDAVGAILKRIDADPALAKRTMVLFFSDNGSTPEGRSAPFRGGKHSLYDGGVRSPSAIRWTGKIKAGTRTTAMVCAEDLFPTLLSLTGTPIPQKLALDGKDFSACLFDSAAPSPRAAQFWLWRDCDGVRTATHKLIRYADRRELYALADDPGETNDLAQSQPALAMELEKRLDEWEASVPVYPTHVPPKISGLSAAPSGDVIEVCATRDAQTRRDQVAAFPIGTCEPFQLQNSDRLEFDVWTDANSSSDGWRIDAINPERGKRATARPAVRDNAPPGTWRRLTSGLANHGPRRLDTVWLVFEGRTPAKYHLKIDNVMVRRGDGSAIVLYESGAPSERPAEKQQGYSDISLCAAPAGQKQAAPAPSPQQKRNVLLIVADDLNTDLGCYGHPLVKTPNIDRLAQRGVRFERAYCQYPVCNPSRASFLTGLRPDTTKVLGNDLQIRKTMPDVVTLPQLFKQNGYATISLGKIFHRGLTMEDLRPEMDDPASWTIAKYFQATPLGLTGEGRNLTGGRLKWCRWLAADGGDEDQPDGMIAAQAISALKEYKDMPLFLAVGFHKPHDPFNSPKKYFDQYPLDSLKLAARPADASEETALALPRGTRNEFAKFTDVERREFMRAYYAGVSFTDAQVGKVIDALDQTGLSDHTVVIFLGDHGYHLGEHGWWNKQTLFERSARPPLIVLSPGAAGNGKTCVRIVEFVDLYPTIARLAGVAAPDNLQGISFQPLLNDPDRPWKPAAITQVERGKSRGYSIRTDRWRYTEWDHAKSGRELYDETQDPGEYYNLAERQENNGIMEELSRELERRRNARVPL